MSLGLARGTVDLLAYDPSWVTQFEQEKQLLLTACGPVLLAIEHVGSTAVPGLDAKPIIDMIASVESFDTLDQLTPILQTLGYEYMPERMYSDRKFFPKGPQSQRTHHLNIVIKDNPTQWYSVIAFRDYLRTNTRHTYQQLKQQLAQQHPTDRAAYTRGKDHFIAQCLTSTNQ